VVVRFPPGPLLNNTSLDHTIMVGVPLIQNRHRNLRVSRNISLLDTTNGRVHQHMLAVRVDPNGRHL
jgi:hypothetical protein